MNYKIFFSKKAQKFFDSQTAKIQLRLATAISKLPIGDTKPLKGQINMYRLRVGNQRVIYTIDNINMIITIVEIGNRGQIYK